MPQSKYRFLVEALLFLTYAVFGLSWIAVTPLVGELQSQFHVSAAELGLLTTTVSVAKVIAPDVQAAFEAQGVHNLGFLFLGPRSIASKRAINTIEEMFADPQVRDRGLRVDLPDAAGTMIPGVRTPVILSETPLRYERPSPRLGEHQEEVLAELAELERTEAKRKASS